MQSKHIACSAAILLAGRFALAAPPDEVKFKMHTINAESKFEAAGVLDVDKDGKLDIFCGGFWYKSPKWEKVFVRELKELDEYFVDFANLPADVDGDGWTDIVDAAWHNKAIFWLRNPGKAGDEWKINIIDELGNIETALPVDINGDKQLDYLPNCVTDAAWYEYKKDPSEKLGVKWIKHPLPKEAAGHGIGVGDINGDGRVDIVAPRGWVEQPEKTDGKWEFHQEFDFGSTSIPILVHDVEGDGDADLIYGLGHDYGLFWVEQQKDAAGKRTWTRHEIDKSWSQPHFMLMVDLDNCGKAELLTGKRYRAHNGHDPGENDPKCIYYYKFDKAKGQWARHTVTEKGPAAFGIQNQVIDIDGDGDLDFVAPGKSGLYLFENLLKRN